MDSSRVAEPALPQISVRMSAELKAAFTAYADRFGIEISGLANLLILREKRRRKLASLGLSGRPPERPRQERGKAVPRQHVTIYFRSIDKTIEFENYATSCKLKRTDAIAWLLELELREKWLERSLARG